MRVAVYGHGERACPSISLHFFSSTLGRSPSPLFRLYGSCSAAAGLVRDNLFFFEYLFDDVAETVEADAAGDDALSAGFLHFCRPDGA